MQDNGSLDRTDRRILHELQHNGRLANSALAERVNLSESACLRRVRRLEESGMLRGYVALVDQSKAGYPDNVFVTITLESQQQTDLAAFEREVKELPEVMECHMMSGEADYLLRVIRPRRPRLRTHPQPFSHAPAGGGPGVHSSFALRTVLKRTELPIRD